MNKIYAGILLYAATMNLSFADIGIPCDELASITLIGTSEIYECSIESVGDSDIFNFNGVEGNTVVLTLSDTGNIFGSISADVLDPGATLVTTLQAVNSGVHEELLLGSTGTYTIVVNENGNDAEDTYNLSLQSRDPLPAEALNLDNDIVAADKSISPIADSDVYFFSGSAGTSQILTLSDTGNIFASLLADVYAPDLSFLTSLTATNSGVETQLDLVATGTYTIVVRENGDNDNDTFNLSRQQLFPTAPAAVPLSYGLTSGDQDISPISDSDVYTFSGNAGDLVNLTLSDIGNIFGSVLATVYDPGAVEITTLTATNTGVDEDITIAQDGIYTVRVRENGNDDTDIYTLNLICIIGVCQNQDNPNISVTPDRFNFGNVNVGTDSATGVFVVGNSGVSNLTGLVVVSDNPVFSIQNDNCTGATVLPGDNCTFETVFSPLTGNRIISLLRVNSNDPDTPVFDVRVVGTGVGGGTPGVLGGSIFGMRIGRTTCTNRATGQSVVIQGTGVLSWDCGEAGLVSDPGDSIQIVVVGNSD